MSDRARVAHQMDRPQVDVGVPARQIRVGRPLGGVDDDPRAGGARHGPVQGGAGALIAVKGRFGPLRAPRLGDEPDDGPRPQHQVGALEVQVGRVIAGLDPALG